MLLNDTNSIKNTQKTVFMHIHVLQLNPKGWADGFLPLVKQFLYRLEKLRRTVETALWGSTSLHRQESFTGPAQLKGKVDHMWPIMLNNFAWASDIFSCMKSCI